MKILSSFKKALFPGDWSPRRIAVYAAIWLVVLILTKVVLVPYVKGIAGEDICHLEATHCAALASAVGLETALEENIVRVPGRYAIQVWFPCTGIDYLLCIPVMIALFPVPMRRRFLWCLLFPAGFYALVILRLFFLLWLGLQRPDWVKPLHDSWNVGFAVLFCFVWLGFLLFAVKNIHSKASPHKSPRVSCHG